MEPIVIIVKEIKDDKIVLTEEELKKIVKRAYDDGYNTGRQYNWWQPNIIYTTSTNDTYCPPPINITSTDKTTNPNLNITCEAHNGIGD